MYLDFYYLNEDNEAIKFEGDIKDYYGNESYIKRADVCKELINTPNGDILISTVFLGFDHSYHPNEKHLFETMIFTPSWEDLYTKRYSTYDEALNGHNLIAEKVKRILKEENNGNIKKN